MSRPRRFVCVVVLAALAVATGCTSGNGSARTQSTDTAPTSPLAKRPLPPRVHVRASAQGVMLADPAFKAAPGARADFGRLAGAVYQIEMPLHWNGRLVLYMHGFEELGPEAHVGPPDFRRYLIGHGIAWGASSFSSTGLIPGRAADETAALWDYFARKYGRPSWTYVTGHSMGGLSSHIAAERYANRFDGALAMCGCAGATPGVMGQADFFAAGAYWRRSELLVAAQLAPNRDTKYQLEPLGTVTSEEFNRAVLRLPINRQWLHDFVAGNDITGRLQMPLLSLHTTGDGQVPIEQARILQRRVDTAGKRALLVQRVMRDPDHCGFTTPEQVAGFEALVRWVEHGVKPQGTTVLVDDLRKLDRTFELSPRPGLREANAVAGASDRVVVGGSATLDGAPFDATYLGAVVLRGGLVTPCQYTLPPVAQGRFEITVLADTESSGCGAPGAQIVLWTFAHNKILYSTNAVAWPGKGRATSFTARYSTSAPAGAAPTTAQFNGAVFRRDGRQLPPGTRVEAYIRGTRCGIESVRSTGSFTGYILAVVGPDSIAGCTRGARLTFRIDGRLAADTSVVNTPPGQQGALDLTLP